MILPYDIARCTGTTQEQCQYCRRLEPGNPHMQWMIAAEIDINGYCPNMLSCYDDILTTNTTEPILEINQ